MKLNNKKGFTLVEMLSVMVILAVLIGLAVPAYYTYIRSAEKEAYRSAEKDLTDSATTAMLECVNDRGNEFCRDKKFPQNDNEYIKLTMKELIESSYMDPVHDPKNRKKYCDEENSYAYIVKNKESETGGYSYFACLKCSNYESTACNMDILNQSNPNQ